MHRLPAITATFALTGLLVACPAKGDTPARVKSERPATTAAADSPAPAVRTQPETEALNSEALTQFEALAATLITHFAEHQHHPENFLAFENEILVEHTFVNPFTAKPLRADYSILGGQPGDYSYSAITLPDATTAGYVFFGYGDSLGDGPSDENTETYFEARNWIEWNKASTDPRLPNDIPANTLLMVFHLEPGIGETPPADYEAPPQEALVGD